MVRFFPAAAMSSSSEDSSLQLQQIAADCLVIAVPSTGQVSQLALDLMVSSATTNSAAAAPRVQLLGWLDSENHVAMVGTEQFDRRPDGRPRPQLCLPLELYGLGTAADDKGNCSSSERRWRLALLQTRAPLLRGHAAAYVEELVAWVKSCPFGRVVLVAGAAPTAEEMLDPAARLWFSRNSHAQGASSDADAEAWAGRFGARDVMASAQSITTTAHHGPVVAQTGIAGPLLQALEGAGVAASALYAVVAEGDNEQDSARLVHVLLESLLGAPGGEAVMPLVAPRSWELLFGRANRREMEAF